MQSNIKILIIGNGFGGTYTLKHLQKLFKNRRDISLNLIADKNYFLFTPLLHEIATGGINAQNISEPIRKVLGQRLDNFYLGKAELINLKDQLVTVNNTQVNYDYLVLAPGAETNFYGLHGAEDNCFTLKSVDDAVKIRNHIITQIERASQSVNQLERQKMLRFVVIGGGPTGVELACEIHEFINETFKKYYRKEVVADASVILVELGGALVPSFGKKISDKTLKILTRKGIHVMLNTKVKDVTENEVLVNDDLSVFTETAIWVAGVKPVKLNWSEQPETMPDGRILVNEFLQLPNSKNVFIIGDMAAFKQSNSALPPLAQVAEQEARSVARNIFQVTKPRGKQKPFFYKHKGYMLSLGKWMAAGEIMGIAFSGRLAWLLWRMIYLSKLISVRRKIEVFTYWTLNLFSPRDISQM